MTFSIFNVLTKKNREKLIYPIAKEFQKLYNIQTGVQIVQISSSVALTEAQKAEFAKLVSNAISKQVLIEESVDESLIGGYVLRVGDTQIDTSVKKKLNELKLALS